MFATTGVLTELLASGAATERVPAALPALLLVGAAFGLRGAVDVGVSLAHARITPAVRRLAEERLYAASLAADLAAFDDAGFHDRMHRARDRGLFFLERAADNLVELIGAVLGIVAATGSLAVLHPVLVPVLLLAVLPDGWAVQRAAKLAYASVGRTVALDRRVQMVADLATEREPAAEIRAYQARTVRAARVPGGRGPVAGRGGPARHRPGTGARHRPGRSPGSALALTYVVLGGLVRYGWVPLAVAGTAVIAIRVATTALNRLVPAANQLVEQGMYVADYQEFLASARRSARRTASTAPIDPGRVTLDGVTFHYPGSSRPAVRDVSLTIRRRRDHRPGRRERLGQDHAGQAHRRSLPADVRRGPRGTATTSRWSTGAASPTGS